jgi:hydrogenase-4 component B
LAVACFVKAYGAVFLGQPRTSRAERGHESPYSMIFPMAALAVCCAIIGIFPGSVVGAINRVVASWPTMGSHAPAVQSLVPVALLTWMNVPLAVLIIVAFAFGARRSKVARQQRWSTTWDCGFATSSPRIQYTASSFAQMIVWSFRAVLRPRIDEPKIVAVFAGSTEFESHVGDVVLDEVVTPGWRGFGSRLRPLRALQWGSVQQYIFYILVILILLLCVFVVPIMELLRSF